jgi:hypothetical protein
MIYSCIYAYLHCTFVTNKIFTLTHRFPHAPCLSENENDNINDMDDYGDDNDDDYNDNEGNDGILSISLLILYCILSTVAQYTPYTFEQRFCIPSTLDACIVCLCRSHICVYLAKTLNVSTWGGIKENCRFKFFLFLDETNDETRFSALGHQFLQWATVN